VSTAKFLPMQAIHIRGLDRMHILCHLVAKFSFAQVEGESIQLRFMATLLPIVSITSI
jgi:hypothetical protein